MPACRSRSSSPSTNTWTSRRCGKPPCGGVADLRLQDPGGPIRRGVPVLLSFTLIGAAVTAGFGLLRDSGPAVAMPLGMFGLFCASFARIYGQAPNRWVRC